MTEQLRKSLERLSQIAPKLNQATDRATSIINKVEEFLANSGVGMPANADLGYREVVVCKDEETGDQTTGSEFSSVNYDRDRNTGRYRLLYKTWREDSSGNLISEDEDVVLAQAPRHMKLEAVGALPQLLQAVAEAAEQAMATADANAEAVEKLLEGLDSAGTKKK